MSRHDENIEDFLGETLHSTPQQEMEAAGDRVLQRLRWEGWKTVEISIPERVPARRTWRFLSVAAAAVVAVVISTMFWPAGSAAVVEAADNGLFKVIGSKVQALKIGEKIVFGETIRSDGASSAVLAVDDGTRIEMRSMSELALESANDGMRIRLNDGSVIVSAAKESKHRWYVQTKDTTVALTNTVSLVTAEETGSRVAVIQGEARVEQGGLYKWVRRGEQVATVPVLEPKSIAEGISWSRRAQVLMPLVQVQAQAQDPATPKWEVVAIKPCDSSSTTNAPGVRGNNGAAENFTVSPGRFSTVCMRLSVLTNLAYVTNGEPLLNSQGLDRQENMKGGPDWVYSSKLSDRYSIEAKAEGTPDRKVILGPMLRALLEDRFQLKSHRETEEISMFGLQVAKGGLKIKPISDADCTPDDLESASRKVEQVRRGERGFCNFVLGQTVSPGTMGWAFGGHTMTAFAGIVSRWVRRPVIDQTGTPGKFRIYIEISDRVGAGALDDGLPPETPRGPDPVSAIQDQLGLKLVDVKGAHQFIVIDHAERPSEN
jgi:uncharacterized protein (TIGR03435 family)